MALIKVMSVLHTADGLPENFVTNSWHFDDGGGQYSQIKDALTTFYVSLRGMYSPLIQQSGHEFKMYQVSDPEPRAPKASFFWQFDAAPAGTALPSEVAMVLSFQAAQVSGQIQARRRGRVYLGPLNVAQVAANGGRPATANTTLIKTAAQALLSASTASSTWKWSTYSTVNNNGFSVANGWVDDAFDTQRRRGVAPANRFTW